MVKKPRILLQLLFVAVLSIYTFSLFTHPIYSDEASDLQQQIDAKNQELLDKKTTLSSVEAKIKEISGSNNTVSQKIALINAEIDKLNKNISETEGALNTKIKEIEEKQELLESKKTEMDVISGDLYMQSRYRIATFFLSGDSWDDLVKEFFIKKNTLSMLKTDVEKINGEFSSLAESKAELETQKTELDAQKKDMDDSYSLLAAEKAKLQRELSSQYSSKSSLSSQIGSLTKEISQLQQFLTIAKSGGTVIDASSVPNSSSDPASSLVYFRSNAPSGAFSVFAFGAYTHRNGMSQWGARARAEAGQTYQQILAAYFPGKVFRTGSVINKSTGASEAIMTKITTTTYGTMNFEDDYLLRLNEMPESWSMQALKAQAIIARTFAINYTNNGRSSICTTESCQVIGTTKKTGAWADAVSATRGIVLTDTAGKVFSTQYAAVHGGWGNNVGWDTTTKKGDYTNWTGDAWESISGVSWFYKTWFRKGYATTGSDCGHAPWLTNTEMTDILNAYLLWISNGKTESDPRIVSTDVYKCWGQAANPYSISELRSLVSNPVTSVSSAVSSNHGGTTSSISFNTNRGIVTISGADFKAIYNMRAPSYLSIPQSGFININIEYK
ncbi:hypothetical protein KKA50_02170 [Patescibacteria group bacterium]|nr:hypothetical protein [Patescibacteria group bacterium]